MLIPLLSLMFGYYLTVFEPRLFPESAMALIVVSSGKQFLDNST